MRQLRLKPQNFATPEAQAHHEAEWAEAQQALAALPVPPGLPPVVQESFAPAAFAFIVSVAKQYQQQGLTPLELVTAGHQAMVASTLGCEQRPEKWLGHWSWWVRQGILKALTEKTAVNRL